MLFHTVKGNTNEIMYSKLGNMSGGNSMPHVCIYSTPLLTSFPPKNKTKEGKESSQNSLA